MNQPERNDVQSMSLIAVEPNRSVIITDVSGGHGLKSRLAAMGLVKGQQVEVLRNNRGGPVVISVMGSRLMMGRGMAHKIIVQPAE